ncbi:hypothetical protein LSTR_LSTR005303 [Laodelphax striatellus]|uniref:Uncharacterized protein n=1 Tax=Laodelphax striatellus TaxID=195883 RepID=A0A482X957_LAOST|nr:hypothetical protein LSTR_LSTR005303 [Laodelphax striatellus]
MTIARAVSVSEEFQLTCERESRANSSHQQPPGARPSSSLHQLEAEGTHHIQRVFSINLKNSSVLSSETSKVTTLSWVNSE